MLLLWAGLIVTLPELIDLFREHLFLPDPGLLIVTLGALVANYLPGDPVWMLFVAPPAYGKTEILNALDSVADCYPVSSITEAGLLSGSMSRNENATGGLLAEMTKAGQQAHRKERWPNAVKSFGVIVAKDVTSILSKVGSGKSGVADARLDVIAALREIFDGKWDRLLGSDGGRHLAWHGKCGFLGAVTESIDRFSTVMGAMGERFLLYRLPILDNEGRLEQGMASITNVGRQGAFREELAQAVSDFMAGLNLTYPELPSSVAEALVRLADLTTRCRSSVERSGSMQDIELAYEDEAPARVAAELAQLYRGLRTLGLDESDAWQVVVKVALDSMPKMRRVIVQALAESPQATWQNEHQLADRVRLNGPTVRRTLEDLAVHGAVERTSDSHGGNRWHATDWLLQRWRDLGLSDRVGLSQ